MPYYRTCIDRASAVCITLPISTSEQQMAADEEGSNRSSNCSIRSGRRGRTIMMGLESEMCLLRLWTLPSPVRDTEEGRRRRREGGKGGGVCSSLSLSETALVSVVQPDRRIGAPRPCDRKGGLDSYSTRELRCGGDAFLFTETERWAQNEWDWGGEEMPTWNIALLQYSKWARVHATLLTYHTVLPRALFQALATNKMRDRENEGGNTNKRTRDTGKGRWKGRIEEDWKEEEEEEDGQKGERGTRDESDGRGEGDGRGSRPLSARAGEA